MPLKSYLHLVASQPRLLGFGFAMTFASSIGQTFFIGAFGPSIQQEFALSHGEWGAIYMAGTLLSAAFLPWTGAQIDRLPLGRRQRRIGNVVDALNESNGHLVRPRNRANFKWGYGYLDNVSDALILCAADGRPGHFIYNVGYPAPLVSFYSS